MPWPAFEEATMPHVRHRDDTLAQEGENSLPLNHSSLPTNVGKLLEGSRLAQALLLWQARSSGEVGLRSTMQ